MFRFLIEQFTKAGNSSLAENRLEAKIICSRSNTAYAYFKVTAFNKINEDAYRILEVLRSTGITDYKNIDRMGNQLDTIRQRLIKLERENNIVEFLSENRTGNLAPVAIGEGEDRTIEVNNGLENNSEEKVNEDVDNSEIINNCVGLMTPVLLIQKKSIESKFGSLPDKAYDEFSLGYVLGVCNQVIEIVSIDNQELIIQIIIAGLIIAYGEDKMESLFNNISVFAQSQPDKYVLGQRIGAEDCNNSIGAPIPAMKWYRYVSGEVSIPRQSRGL